MNQFSLLHRMLSVSTYFFMLRNGSIIPLSLLNKTKQKKVLKYSGNIDIKSLCSFNKIVTNICINIYILHLIRKIWILLNVTITGYMCNCVNCVNPLNIWKITDIHILMFYFLRFVVVVEKRLTCFAFRMKTWWKWKIWWNWMWFAKLYVWSTTLSSYILFLEITHQRQLLFSVSHIAKHSIQMRWKYFPLKYAKMWWNKHS